jgi:hypothetical protein
MYDYSFTKNVLQWNFEKALTAGLIDEISKTKGGNKKTDKGKPPYLWNQCMTGKCYNLACAVKSKSECLSVVDAK